MKLLYIIFYIVLDLMIFSFLIKKIRLSKTMWKIAVGFILIGFSMALFLFKFGKTVAIKVNGVFNKTKDELLIKWFEFWTGYVIYIMVLVTQIGTIISN